MIILITGASHTGKTALAQKLMEKYSYPYLSIDHLKMGLIRSGYTDLTALSNHNDLTGYLWPVVREIIKTAIENNQNLIVEGCYIPFDWQESFSDEYLDSIKYCCLVMTGEYIQNNFGKIMEYANVIEKRLCDDCAMEEAMKDNAFYLENARLHNLGYILIDDEYDVDIDF